MQQNSEKDSKSPILNNPYEEPRLYYDTDADGNLDYSRIVQGRRPYTSNIDIMPSRQGQQSLFGGSDYENNDPNAKFINDIRIQVRQWRESNYPGVTRITHELLCYWFKNPERQWHHRLFFCQREAVETAIYLNEVADQDPNIGRDLLRQLGERRNTVSDNPLYVLPRTAFKMATGTGKTVVMAMLILYNYLNKRDSLIDTRFVDTFLIIAPGITIRERLNSLMVDNSHRSRFDLKDDYHRRDLVPRQFEPLLGGLNASITIINYQQLEPKMFTGKHISPFDGKMEYVDGKMRKPQGDKQGKQDYNVMFHKLLRNINKGKRMMVINDEAHHCYYPKSQKSKSKNDEETAAAEAENEKAMVWYEGLRQMKLCGYRLQHVYDLSATPYYLKGSGYDAYSLFPWVVSDFGLVDAIESGLVKIPFLPSFDNTHDLEEPKFRNIYKHVSDELSRMGVRATRKKAKEEGEDIHHEAPPQLPTLVNTALDQFVKDYEAYERGVRPEGEERADLYTTPPVFIIVCSNTMVSHEVFKYIAGYQTTDENGKTITREGHFPVFSNYNHLLQPKKKAPTLLVDSIAVDDASNVITDDFKQLYANEIEAFKRDYAVRKGQGDANKISDEDILREVINTVGKRGTLGEHIRCVVSVSMLSEGWDANTVTHVMGIRAFGSQLLCEQVVGRALRRRNYDLQAYDLEGNELDPKTAKLRKKNVIFKFPPEYAHVIGVPFKTFKAGKGGVPKPPKPTTDIEAIKERDRFEIRFPNIEGYRSESPDGDIRADYEGVEKLRMPFTEIPTQTVLQSPISGKKEILKTDCAEYRDAQVVYYLTWQLLRTYYSSRESGHQFQLFGQLRAVVEKWYNEQIEIVGGDETPDIMRRLVLLWNTEEVLASIYSGIRQANRKDERITAILNYYNPEGSTANVNGKTTKPVWPTVKSHVNYVVADTKSWEQIAAKTMEEMDEVVCYVKNHFLGFRIPYMAGVEEHPYIPDFIARVNTPRGEQVNLIIEVSGFSDDSKGHKDAKRHYTNDYWLPAANNMQKYGRWEFVEVSDIDNIKQILIKKIQTL
jgi:type III restriction enzyme